MSKIYVIGGANLDVYAKSKNDLVLKDSNISKINFSFGGVARNIVENLANVKAETVFVTAVGDDAFGKDILTNLQKKNVDTHHSLICDGYSTSTYMAILNQDDMYLGMCDTSVLDDNLKLSHIQKLAEEINDDDYVIFDTNLSKDIIDAICSNLKGRKVVDAISTNKVNKLLDSLNKLGIFKLNKYEAEKISGIQINSDEDIKTIIKLLRSKGVEEVLVSGGSKLYIGTGDKVLKIEHHAYNENPVNVSGAGDSLIANYTYARFYGLSIEEAAGYGISAAVLTVNDENAVASLDLEMIRNNIENLKLDIKEI